MINNINNNQGFMKISTCCVTSNLISFITYLIVRNDLVMMMTMMMALMMMKTMIQTMMVTKSRTGKCMLKNDAIKICILKIVGHVTRLYANTACLYVQWHECLLSCKCHRLVLYL